MKKFYLLYGGKPILLNILLLNTTLGLEYIFLHVCYAYTEAKYINTDQYPKCTIL